MNKKDITDAVIINSKTIHELGGRLEVEVGDFIINIFQETGKIKRRILVKFGDSESWDYELKDFPESYLLVASARKCKEWLRERGWFIERYDEWPNEVHIGWHNNELEKGMDITAPTEDEACQLAVIKILKNDN